MAKTQVTIPLDIPEVEVLKTEINRAGELIIMIESTKKTTNCRRCGKEIHKFHGHDKWVTLRYLPVFGRPTYLRYRPKRYRCEHCDDQPTTTQRVEWHEPKSPNVREYERSILLQLVNSTIKMWQLKKTWPTTA